MNFNQFTTKAQEAVQLAQQLAMQNGQQAIETGHLLRGLLDTDEYVLPHLFRKLSVNTKALDAALTAIVNGYPKVSGAKVYFSNGAQQALAKATSLMSEMKDEFVTLEHLALGILVGDDQVARLLKDAGVNEKDLRNSINELRKGQKATSQSAEETYNALNKYAKNLNEAARAAPFMVIWPVALRSLKILLRLWCTNSVTTAIKSKRLFRRGF